MRQNYITCSTNNPNSHNVSNAHNITVQNTYYNSDNDYSENKNNRNKTMTNSNTNSDTNSKIFLSSDNNTERNTVTRDESNTAFDEFINCEGMIACAVE